MYAICEQQRRISACAFANNKGAYQPGHPRSLISAFVVRYLDSIIHMFAIVILSRLWLASVAEQAGLSLIWPQTPEDRFYRDEAHIMYVSLDQLFDS